MLVNQTPYDLEPGCIGILHSYHVFRFENSSSVPLDIQVLVYPYPEMVLMDFTQQNTGTEDGSACDCSVFSPLDTAEREKVESLLDTFQEELNVPDNTTPLIRNCLFIQLRQIHISGSCRFFDCAAAAYPADPIRYGRMSKQPG